MVVQTCWYEVSNSFVSLNQVTSITQDARSISQSTLSMAHVSTSKNKYKRKFRFQWTGFILAAVEGKKPKDQDHHHDLSQGDPLSPLLFILVMDIINLALAKVAEAGLLQPLSPRL
jgi:hypothetical protein